MAADAGAARVLSLLRRILRLHRERLPAPMRSIGDKLAVSEFRRHLRGQTTEQQWRVFGAEWQRYLAMLDGTADQLAAAAAGNAQAGTQAARAGSSGGQSSSGAPAAGGEQPDDLASVTAAIATGSGDFAETLLPLMSPDQQRQLVKMRQEALALGAEMLGKDASPLLGGADGSLATPASGKGGQD